MGLFYVNGFIIINFCRCWTIYELLFEWFMNQKKKCSLKSASINNNFYSWIPPMVSFIFRKDEMEVTKSLWGGGWGQPREQGPRIGEVVLERASVGCGVWLALIIFLGPSPSGHLLLSFWPHFSENTDWIKVPSDCQLQMSCSSLDSKIPYLTKHLHLAIRLWFIIAKRTIDRGHEKLNDTQRYQLLVSWPEWCF